MIPILHIITLDHDFIHQEEASPLAHVLYSGVKPVAWLCDVSNHSYPPQP